MPIEGEMVQGFAGLILSFTRLSCLLCFYAPNHSNQQHVMAFGIAENARTAKLEKILLAS
jgi:hypothetical protein